MKANHFLHRHAGGILMAALCAALLLSLAVIWVQPAAGASSGPEGSCDGYCRYQGTYVICNYSGCQATPYRDYRVDKYRCCNACDGCWREFVRYCTRGC